MISGWRIMRSEIFLVLVLLVSLISTGASDYPGSGAGAIVDAPMEMSAGGANVSVDLGLGTPADLKVGLGADLGLDLVIPTGREASKIPVPKAGSGEVITPISVLLNKAVWLEIENRTLDGGGPHGRLVVNRLPIASPDFNRLLEDSGYAKVREFENESGSCGWWEDPGAPKLPYKEDAEEDEDDVQDLGAETVQVKRFYVGWAYSNTYHYPDCRWARNIPLGSQVWFSSPEEARAEGYVPCSTCNPP